MVGVAWHSAPSDWAPWRAAAPQAGTEWQRPGWSYPDCPGNEKSGNSPHRENDALWQGAQWRRQLVKLTFSDNLLWDEQGRDYTGPQTPRWSWLRVWPMGPATQQHNSIQLESHDSFITSLICSSIGTNRGIGGSMIQVNFCWVILNIF